MAETKTLKSGDKVAWETSQGETTGVVDLFERPRHAYTRYLVDAGRPAAAEGAEGGEPHGAA